MQADQPHTLFMRRSDDEKDGKRRMEEAQKRTRASDRVLRLQEEENRRMEERRKMKERGEYYKDELFRR